MKKLQEIRKMHYREQKKKIVSLIGPYDINDWFKNPYSCLKVRFCIETSAVIVFIAQYTSITPNFLTFMFAFLGVISGIFLASNNEILIIISLILQFSKGIFDWADGLLARIKKKTSELGDLLDNWAAHVGEYSFLCGFGIYLYHKNGEEHFVVLSIIIILIKSLDLKDYAYQLSMYKFFHASKKKKLTKKIDYKKKDYYNKYATETRLILLKNFFQNFLDHRSRTVDFICLLIFIDTFYINITLLNYIYYLILFRTIVLFCGGFYIVYFKNFLKKIK